MADVRVACLTPETNIEAGSLIPTNGAVGQHDNVRVVVWDDVVASSWAAGVVLMRTVL
jgi:hypothetical protein